jgi:hypothetical protein
MIKKGRRLGGSRLLSVVSSSSCIIQIMLLLELNEIELIKKKLILNKDNRVNNNDNSENSQLNPKMVKTILDSLDLLSHIIQSPGKII